MGEDDGVYAEDYPLSVRSRTVFDTVPTGRESTTILGSSFRRIYASEAVKHMAVRVLVVEDFEIFRRFVCSKFATRSHLQIIGEASNGMEAVRKAEELQPDLILLDIGLPALNGMVAARRIRKLSPESKIIFVTQESDHDVVQEAFNLGAWAYVVKTDAETDLLPAVDTVLEGRQFLSSVLSARGVTTVSAD